MRDLVQELKKRNVFRVAAAYLMLAWIVAQVAELVLDSFEAPPWVMQSLLLFLALGLPIAVFMAWVFELTPEGLKREEDVDRSRPRGRKTGRKLDYLIIGLLAVALAYFVIDKAQRDPGATDHRSIAVLPFANRSVEDDTQFLVDGVHDDLLTQLARHGDLKVISRTSVLEYRDTTKNMRQIGQELGVATLLEGAVQRSGDRIRVTAQLIDAESDAHIWASSYDRELTPANVFEIQSDIARAIAGELSSVLGEDSANEALDNAPTQNQEAFDLYLRARAMPYDGAVDQLWRSIELAKRAVQIDPDFAIAMGQIADNYINIYWFTSQQPEHRDAAKDWIERALTIAPDDPQLQLVLSTILYEGYLDYEAALSALDKAQQGMPGHASVYLNRAVILRRSGDIEGAIEAFEKAQLLDPRDVFSMAHHIFTFMYIGDVAGARAQGERVLAFQNVSPVHVSYTHSVDLYLLGNTQPLADMLLSDANAELGPESYLRVEVPLLERRYDDALVALEMLPNPIVAQFNLWPHSFVRARLLHAQGEFEEARAQAQLAVAELDRIATTMADNARPVVARALMHAILGNRAEAMADAKRATELYPIEIDPVDGPNYVADGLRALALILDTEALALELDKYLSLTTKVYYIDYLLLDPVYDRHRDHPAIKALQAEYTLRAQ